MKKLTKTTSVRHAVHTILNARCFDGDVINVFVNSVCANIDAISFHSISNVSDELEEGNV